MATRAQWAAARTLALKLKLLFDRPFKVEPIGNSLFVLPTD